MKRLLPIIMIALILTTLFPLGAANMQKTFHKSDPEYQMTYALCISAGVLPPSQVSPVTGAELAKALSRIDYQRLSLSEKEAYDSLMKKLEYHPILESDVFGFDPRPTISFDAVAHTSGKTASRDMLFQREDRLDGINLKFEMAFADIGYGRFNWLMLSPSIKDYTTGKYFNTNFDTWFKGNITDMQHEGVFDAGILFGNDWMNFSIMSGRQEMGGGKTGNFAIGDNFVRQQYLRFHTFSKWFDYTYSLTRYGKMKDGTGDDPGSLSMVSNGESFDSPQQVFPLHRFTFKIADKVDISVSEGAMMLIDNIFNPAVLNPFLFIHGFDNYADNYERPVESGDEANNILVLELGWTILPHHRISFQAMSDQIQMGDEGKEVPNALSFLMNYETSWIIGEEYLNGWVEAAYTMPAVYLNTKLANKTGPIYNHNYDYIVGYPMWGFNDADGDIDYAGYKYGPDSIVFGLGANYGRPGLFSLETSLTYIIHGAYGLGYKHAIATRNEAEAKKLFSVPLSDAEHRIELLAKGTYIPMEGLELIGGVGLVQVWNYQTNKGENRTDLQVHIGVKFDPVGMFSK